MAGFVVHDIAAREFLNKILSGYINLSDVNIRDFLFGNLIVDSLKIKRKKVSLETSDKELDQLIEQLKIKEIDLFKEEKVNLIKKRYYELVQEEKIITHFRSRDDINKNIQIPQLDLFINKYKDLLINGDFSALGYLFHLYTDKRFFSVFSKEAYIFLDENSKPSSLINETKKVYIKKNNKTCDINDFHSLNMDISLYDDYTTMNKILLDYYHINFNAEEQKEKAKSFNNPGIREVNYNNIISIIDKMETFIQESRKIKNPKLNIFTEEQVINFIEDTVKQFIFDYYDIIDYFIELGEQKRYILKTNM